jgi:hypothetical protein
MTLQSPQTPPPDFRDRFCAEVLPLRDFYNCHCEESRPQGRGRRGNLYDTSFESSNIIASMSFPRKWESIQII